MPILITVTCVIGIVYGAANLIISQIKPAPEPVSTITVTKNTPSASELNLSAPLVDYNPNKDECGEELLEGESEEDRDKRVEECKKKEEEKKDEEDSSEGAEEATEVLGESEEKLSFGQILAKRLGEMTGAGAGTTETSTSESEEAAEEESAEEESSETE